MRENTLKSHFVPSIYFAFIVEDVFNFLISHFFNIKSVENLIVQNLN